MRWSLDMMPNKWRGCVKSLGPGKPTISDRLLGLMIVSGFMLLVTALPLGLALAFEIHRDSHDDYWAFIGGALMAIALAAVGGVLLGIGEFIVKQRWKQKKETQNEAA